MQLPNIMQPWVVEPEFEPRLVWIEILYFTHYPLLFAMKFSRRNSKDLYVHQDIIYTNGVNVEIGPEK